MLLYMALPSMAFLNLPKLVILLLACNSIRQTLIVRMRGGWFTLNQVSEFILVIDQTNHLLSPSDHASIPVIDAIPMISVAPVKSKSGRKRKVKEEMKDGEA